jgi:hypothetical protein
MMQAKSLGGQKLSAKALELVESLEGKVSIISTVILGLAEYGIK